MRTRTNQWDQPHTAARFIKYLCGTTGDRAKLAVAAWGTRRTIMGAKMKVNSMTGLLALGLALSGCASVIEGTNQVITVNTNPDGATCTLNRMPEGVIGEIKNTPAGVTIRKTKYDITVK